MAANFQTILILSNDPKLGLSIERIVERKGLAQAVIAWNLQQARELLESIRFELIVVDADCQRREGITMMLELAARGANAPVVAVGQQTQRQLDALVEGGLADAAVAKPLDVDEFLKAAFGDDPDARSYKHVNRAPLPMTTRKPMAPPSRGDGVPAPVLYLDRTPVSA